MTDVPFFQDPQFVDSTGLGGLNAAFSTAVDSTTNAGSGLWAVPGLLAPDVMGVSLGTLTLGISLARPWGLVSSGGITVRAHGTQTGQDTTTYSVPFSGLVPLSGSVTAYLAATIQTIQQTTFPVPGPPQGHPAYNPNFVPTAGYAKTVYTVALAAVTGGIDNINTFELLRTTLVAGQVAINSFSTQGWVRAANRKAWPASGVATSSALTPAQAQFMLYPTVAGLTHTLPSLSVAGGLTYGIHNPTAGSGTIATTSLDRIAGFGTAALASITLPASGAVLLYGNAALSVWQVVGFSPGMVPHGQSSFTSNGSFTVPQNVFWLYEEAWGGGGGSVGGIGGSGGGGGYASIWQAVTPGQVIPYVVGAPGAGASSNPAGTGGTTTVGVLTATGGSGGGPGEGGGGVGSGGTTNLNGQNGTDLDATGSYALGAVGAALGGNAAFGGFGGNINVAGAGAGPTVPGGGGGANAAQAAGQAGASGMVRFTW